MYSNKRGLFGVSAQDHLSECPCQSGQKNTEGPWLRGLASDGLVQITEIRVLVCSQGRQRPPELVSQKRAESKAKGQQNQITVRAKKNQWGTDRELKQGTEPRQGQAGAPGQDIGFPAFPMS